jgi:hypothetical protein
MIAAYVSAYTGKRRSGRTHEKAEAVVKAASAPILTLASPR